MSLLYMRIHLCETNLRSSLVAWYVIRYPFERRAKKVGVTKSIYNRRDRILLAFAFVAMFIAPLLHVLTGFSKATRSPCHSGNHKSRGHSLRCGIVVVLPWRHCRRSVC